MKPLYERHDFDGTPGIIGGNCRKCGGPIVEPWHLGPAPLIVPTVEITRYRVSCLPSDHVDALHFSLHVERRNTNPDRWAVSDGAFCYDRDGNREYESIPSSRTEEFKDVFRHSLEDALAIAKRVAPGMTCNSYTVSDVLARDTEPA